jgi:hypothetical protein
VFVYVFFWVMLGLLLLALFAILFVVLRPGRASKRQMSRWSAEGWASETELEDRHRRADEFWTKKGITQSQDKPQATEPDDPKA